MTTDSQGLGQKGMRGWQYHSGAAYVSEFMQTLPESGAGRVEIVESL